MQFVVGFSTTGPGFVPTVTVATTLCEWPRIGQTTSANATHTPSARCRSGHRSRRYLRAAMPLGPLEWFGAMVWKNARAFEEYGRQYKRLSNMALGVSSARASSKLPRGEGANAGCGVRLGFARGLRLPAAGNGSPEPRDCHLNFLLLLCWAAKARCAGVEL